MNERELITRCTAYLHAYLDRPPQTPDVVSLLRDVDQYLANGPDEGGWIHWSGGECPVDGDALVDITLFSGSVHNSEPAKLWYWDHSEDLCNIIAYRLSK